MNNIVWKNLFTNKIVASNFATNPPQQCKLNKSIIKMRCSNAHTSIILEGLEKSPFFSPMNSCPFWCMDRSAGSNFWPSSIQNDWSPDPPPMGTKTNGLIPTKRRIENMSIGPFANWWTSQSQNIPATKMNGWLLYTDAMVFPKV